MDSFTHYLNLCKEAFNNTSGTSVAAVLVAALILATHRLARRRPKSRIPTLGFRSTLHTMIFRPDVLSSYKSVLREKLEAEGLLRVRFGNTIYHLGDAAHAKQFATQPDVFLKVNFQEFNPNSLASTWLGLNMVSANGETWRRFRKVMSPVFRRRWSPAAFTDCADTLIDIWQSDPKLRVGNKTVRVDLHNWTQRLTLDVLGKMILGYDFRALKDKDSPALKDYTRVVHASFQGFYFLFKRLDRPWNPFRRSAWRSLWSLQALFATILREKREQMVVNADSVDDKDKDLLTLMLEASESGEAGESLTDQEILDNTAIFFLAGHDTTATALTAAVYLLAKHPEVQERLLEELDVALPDSESVPDTTTKLPLLDAVIRETLRLYPPVQELPLRIVGQDVELKFTTATNRLAEGRTTEMLPKGSIVKLHTLAIQRNGTLFPNPDAFIPERHLKSTHAGSDDHSEGSGFFAFGGGSRICIGMSFSLLEQRVVLSKLIRRYRFSLPKDSIHRDELIFDGFALVMPRQLDMDMTERS